MSNSVGSFHPSEQNLQTHDLLDLSEPQWPWESFAKHETLSGLRCVRSHANLCKAVA